MTSNPDISTCSRLIRIVQCGADPERWKAGLPSEAPWTWMYVGTDTSRFAALLRGLPTHWERINTGEQVNRVVRGQEDAFINLDEIVDRRGFDRFWLTTDLAERNP